MNPVLYVNQEDIALIDGSNIQVNAWFNSFKGIIEQFKNRANSIKGVLLLRKRKIYLLGIRPALLASVFLLL